MLKKRGPEGPFSRRIALYLQRQTTHRTNGYPQNQDLFGPRFGIPGPENRRELRHDPRTIGGAAFQRRRVPALLQRVDPRLHGLHHPIDLPALGQPHGAADDDRRRTPRLGLQGRGRDALLRLGAPGPQGPAPRADRRQTGGQPAHGRGRGPHHDDGPARRPDTGFLRHSGGRPLRQRHLRPLYREPADRGPLDRRARHGRRQACEHLCQTPRRTDHHFAQGARQGQCRGQDDRHRRRRRP